MDHSDRILIAGARGMVGSALVRRLRADGYTELLAPTRTELDLRDTAAVDDYLGAHEPRYVFIAAATVGGIHANDSFAADFIYDNLMMEANLIHGAHIAGVEKLLFLGSTCIYPKLAPQPMKEEYLLTGPLEPTNEWYAVAKIAGIKLCQAYRKQYGSRFIKLTMAARLSTAKVIIIHAGQIIMYQRIGMDEFDCNRNAVKHTFIQIQGTAGCVHE